MGLLSDKLSWSNILSGGMTGINDDLLKATGMGNNTTLGALNDAAKHLPIEDSLEKGRIVAPKEAWAERNKRLGQDSSGNARTIADIAALVGMAFGGAAVAGGGAAGGGAAGGATGTTGATAATGTTGAATGAAPAASTGGGLMGSMKSVGEAASAAKSAQGLLSPQQQPAQASPVTVGNGSAMGNVYSQIQQAEQQRQQNEMQQRQQRRQGLLGYGG